MRVVVMEHLCDDLAAVLLGEAGDSVTSEGKVKGGRESERH